MSFSASSKNIRFEYPYLKAECLNKNGAYVYSELDLNKGIGNHNGVLKWDHNGNFTMTCDQIFLQGTVLRCKARTPNNQLIESYINLDEKVENSNGQLKFK